MLPIQINVSVNIGATAELMSFLSSLMNSRPTAEATQAAVSAVEDPQAEAIEEPKQEATTEAKVEAEPEKPAAKQEQPKGCTEVDVRAAIDRTRKRIEGENWKENPDGEGYKKWHRALTSWFKSAATAYGADKPSALPDNESRQKFINDCDSLEVAEDGELKINVPF
jgi:hypothetical protein